MVGINNEMIPIIPVFCWLCCSRVLLTLVVSYVCRAPLRVVVHVPSSLQASSFWLIDRFSGLAWFLVGLVCFGFAVDRVHLLIDWFVDCSPWLWVAVYCWFVVSVYIVVVVVADVGTLGGRCSRSCTGWFGGCWAGGCGRWASLLLMIIISIK